MLFSFLVCLNITHTLTLIFKIRIGESFPTAILTLVFVCWNRIGYFQRGNPPKLYRLRPVRCLKSIVVSPSNLTPCRGGILFSVHIVSVLQRGFSRGIHRHGNGRCSMAEQKGVDEAWRVVICVRVKNTKVEFGRRVSTIRVNAVSCIEASCGKRKCRRVVWRSELIQIDIISSATSKVGPHNASFVNILTVISPWFGGVAGNTRLFASSDVVKIYSVFTAYQISPDPYDFVAENTEIAKAGSTYSVNSGIRFGFKIINVQIT